MANPIRAVYWNSAGDVPDTPIPNSTFTHIYYAFVQPDPNTFQLTITQNDQAKLPKFFDYLRPLNPRVRTLLSIGGAKNSLGVFANMASTEQNRQALITSSIAIARQYGFDGVDLDWEFPRSEAEMASLGLLYQQWREALNQEATNGRPRLLLTSAVYYDSEIDYDGPRRAFPAAAIAANVDWINLMCFDYFTAWANFTAPPAALHQIPNNEYHNRNTEHGIRSWIRAGVPAGNLVMGMPLYGRNWTLQDPANNGIGAPAAGVQGPQGETSYRNIVEQNAQNNVVGEYDDQTVSYYSYLGRNWTGYDDVRSVEAKVQFAREKNLAGYFFWALGQDTANWTLSLRASHTWN